MNQDMFERVYLETQKFLDEALGAREEDGSGGGLEADVRLLAGQRDEARAELTRLRSGAATLGATLTHMARTMMAAAIEDQQNGGDAAMEWITQALPDVDDNPPADQWDGKETAAEWLERTEHLERPAAEGQEN